MAFFVICYGLTPRKASQVGARMIVAYLTRLERQLSSSSSRKMILILSAEPIRWLKMVTSFSADDSWWQSLAHPTTAVSLTIQARSCPSTTHWCAASQFCALPQILIAQVLPITRRIMARGRRPRPQTNEVRAWDTRFSKDNLTELWFIPAK